VGEMTQVSEPFGVALTMAYDAIGHRTQVQDSFGGVEDSIYDVSGNLENRMYSQGEDAIIHIEQDFDTLNRVTNLTRYSEGSPAEIVATTDYTYDAAGRITNLHHQTDTPTNIANYTYTYD